MWHDISKALHTICVSHLIQRQSAFTEQTAATSVTLEDARRIRAAIFIVTFTLAVGFTSILVDTM